MANFPVKPLTREHSDFFNAIRALAAFVVLISHLLSIYLLPRYGLTIASELCFFTIPAYAVAIFFILSGFFITYSALNITKDNQGRFSSRQFLLNRLTRLYPPLILSLILIAVIFLFFNHGFENSYSYIPRDAKFSLLNTLSLNLKNYLPNFFFLQGVFVGKDSLAMNRALWTLSYEFWYYIIFMLGTVMVINKRYRSSVILLLILLGALIYRNQFRFLWLFIIWLSGVFLALQYNSSKLLQAEYKKVALFILIILGLIVMMVYQKNDAFYLIAYLTNTALFIQVCLSLMIMLLISLALRLKLDFKNKYYLSLSRSANYSYTLYVIHYPIILFLFRYTWPYIQHWSMITILAVMAIDGLVIIYISKKCAIILENKKLFRRMLSRLFNKGDKALCETN